MRIVYPQRAKKSENPATPAEIAEYSVLLFRIGVVNEALDLLHNVDTSQLPDALLYRAFAHFANWEYKTAIPLLNKYIQAPIPEYDLLVGRVNLAMALVESGEYKLSLDLLERNIEAAKQGGHLQLQCNCHVFRGQAHLQEGRYDLARKDLDQAKSLFELQENYDHFTVRKWNLILSGLTQENPAAFDDLRHLALQRRDWEAIRDADLFELKVRFDVKRLLHLYFGSPFADLRERLRDEYSGHLDRTVYVLGPKKSPRFDISSGKIDDVATAIAGSKCHQLIDVLLLDFYRALPLPALFSKIYPGEHFDVFSSGGRVHELLRRTRSWLASERLPVVIEEHGGFYSLSIVGPFSFRIPLDRRAVDTNALHLGALKACFSAVPTFSTEEARKQLNLSTATVQRVLNHAIALGEVERLGSSKRSALYRVRHVSNSLRRTAS